MKHSVSSILAVTSVLYASVPSAQDYPNKPIRIVTGTAGSSNDFAARIIAPGISGLLSQQVIIDNRVPVLATEAVAKAPPDGYTVHITGSILWIGPLLQSKLAWDSVRDFAPVIMALSAPNLLVVHPSLPVKSVKELVALAKARPGELNFVMGSIGGSSHLTGELFKSLAGVNIVGVAYKGSSFSMAALMGGEVQMAFEGTTSITRHVESGKLRSLAVTSARPSVLAPGLPTVAASGLPGFESVVLTGIFVPAKTSAAVINRLNQEITRVLETPDVRNRFLTSGAETVGGSPEQLAVTIKSDAAKWGKVIKDAGIKVE